MDYIKNNICNNIPYNTIKQHYNKIKYITYLFYFIGIFTLPLVPILPAIMLSFGISGKEFIYRYYILHKEIDKNNYIDWFILEECHNQLFFYVFITLLTTVIYEKTTTIVYINIILTDIFFNIHRFMISYQNIKIKKDNSKRKLYGVNVCNYMCGNDFIDYIHGWGNYRIEQQLFPNLSMLEYQILQPYIKKYCHKNNIEYIQIK
tara:strand:+ start:2239 stop:2853 length:615 start_codon:yes stop_codon:yes gene_type:complete